MNIKALAIVFTVALSVVGIQADAASTGVLDEKIAAGRSLSIMLDPGYWTVSSISNPVVTSATIENGNLVISGNQTGLSTVEIMDTLNGQTITVAVQVTPSTLLNSNVLGATTIKNGQLVKSGATVYQIYKNSKIGFATFPSFTGLGFSTKNIVQVSDDSFVNSQTVITTSQDSHPWGSWVNSNGTIYFVHQLGLIPIADYPTFLNNGGNPAFIVTANSYDMALPQLPIMQMNDYRLQ
jgi:hypothetical protein